MKTNERNQMESVSIFEKKKREKNAIHTQLYNVFGMEGGNVYVFDADKFCLHLHLSAFKSAWICRCFLNMRP